MLMRRKRFKNLSVIGKKSIPTTDWMEIPGVEHAEEKGTFFDLSVELEAGHVTEASEVKEIKSEKTFEFWDIFKELKGTAGIDQVYPDFNYQMGRACREMGYLDEAIEQLQVALQKGECLFETHHLLGLCFKDKGKLNEAQQSLENALTIEGISLVKELEVKKELGIVCGEQGKHGKKNSQIPSLRSKSSGYTSCLKTQGELTF